MSAPQRIQLSRRKGFKLPGGAVNVARPSKFGNPFIVGTHGTRAECVELYRLLLAGYLCISEGAEFVEQQRRVHAYVAKNIARLKGRDLACWCRLPVGSEPDICHAAVLLALAAEPVPLGPGATS